MSRSTSVPPTCPSSLPSRVPSFLPRVFGCDVGKFTIAVFDSRDARTRTIPNIREQLDLFAAMLDDTCLVVCEATGGYEDLLLQAVIKTGHAAHRADARKVKAFIRSFGILGKTDAIDAKALAAYGQERHAKLVRWEPRDPTQDRLQALVLTRRDLVDQSVAFRNRLGAPGAAPIAPYIEPLLACLDTQIAAIDVEVAALIRATAVLKHSETVLRTIVGIGARTAAAVLALMPELGRLDRRQAAALAGLAPHPHQSGKTDAPRRTKGGRPEIKQVLFMATLSATRYDPVLSVAYKNLIARGKKPIVAIIAIMRKIIVIANARLRDAFKMKTETERAI